MVKPPGKRRKSIDEKGQIVTATLERVRRKLIDVSRRNNLINFRETRRTIRMIDELPDETFRLLVSEGKLLEFLPLEPRQQELFGKDKEENLRQVVLPMATDSKSGSSVRISRTQEVTEKADKQQEKKAIDENYELPFPSSNSLPKHIDLRLQTLLSPKPLEQRCKNLIRHWRTGIDEAGINYLYLAIGFLEWYESDDSDVMSRAPLILVPLRIERTRLNTKTNCYSYVISYSGEDVETNLSLAEKLDFDFNLILPEIKEDLSPEKYLSEVKKVIKNQKRWRVAREMIIGFFSFAKLRLYKDLNDESWPSTRPLTGHPVIQDILIGREKGGQDIPVFYSDEYDVDRDLALDKIPLVLDADSSQHSAIIDVVLNEKNLVIEGPPGTGKSQSITNIIAAAIHAGKTVLFISEKKAALEVVRNRMDIIGLGDFCLELHSHKTQKGQLYADLARRLNGKYRDVATLDHEIDEFSKERKRLQTYYDLLNSPAGSSAQTVYDILWASDRWGAQMGQRPMRFFIENALQLIPSQIRETASALEDFIKIHSELPENVIESWRGFEPKLLLPGDDNDILDTLLKIQEATKGFEQRLQSLLAQFEKGILDTLFTSLRNIGNLDTNILKEKPDVFDEDLGSSFLDEQAFKTLKDLKEAIEEQKVLQDKFGKAIGRSDGWIEENLHSIEDGSTRLEAYKYGDFSIKRLRELDEISSNAIGAINALINAAQPLACWLSEPPETLNNLQKILKTYKTLLQAPTHISIRAYPQHALRFTASLFENAHREYGELSKALGELSADFEVEKAPDVAEIFRISETLRNYRNWYKRLLSSDYRRIKKTLRTFVKEAKTVTRHDLSDLLDKLGRTIQRMSEYDKNEDFNKILGPMFKGIKTDWDALGALVSWCQILLEATESENRAQDILNNFTENREIFGRVCKKIVNRWEVLKKDLGALKTQVKLDDKLLQIQEEISRRQQAIRSFFREVPKLDKFPDLQLNVLKEGARAGLDLFNLSTKIENDDRFVRYFGPRYRGFDTDIATIQLTADWIRCLTTDDCYHDKLVCWIVSKDTNSRLAIVEELVVLCREYFSQFDNFISVLSEKGSFSPDGWIGVPIGTASTTHILKKLDQSIPTSGNLILYSDYCNSKRRMANLGLIFIANAIESRSLPKGEALNQLYYSVYRSMANELLRKYPVLANFKRANYENTRERIKRLDQSIQHRSRERIAYIVSKRQVPTGVSSGYVSQYTEYSLIEHELSKKKRHIPIRQLVQRASQALQALKPCFMMSPQSVAQYLNPRGAVFDLVLMDEASQLRLEDALGAIARSNQAVVVGDPKQLPPTIFFERLLEGEVETVEITAAEEAEAILDVCQTCFENRRLKWHYRSEHEQLIAFSNSEFYDNDLIIFPAPFGTKEDYGVKYHFVENALYQKGKNRSEAEIVAISIMDHFKRCPKLSLGVATFNIEQRDLIQDELERLQKRNPWLEERIKKSDLSEEPFFIKNLENVQGDERDVIFISTTYGPDIETRQVYQRFGPINLPMGWRRLNVIVTRAKKRVDLFTSMRSSDIHITPGASLGVRALRKYLEYAEKGTIPDFGDSKGRGEADSDFEIAVSKVLNQNGFKTCFQVGVAGFFIDIGVYHPLRAEEFILGIECDGATYHSAKSIRDRDILRQRILETKGWCIYRIWSTDWFKNKEKETDNLVKMLQKLVEADRIKMRPSEPKRAEKAKASSPRELGFERSSEEQTLRNALREFRDQRIASVSTDVGNSILADDIMEEFIKRKPTTKEEFHQFSYEIRSRIAPEQSRFLDEILDIIENIAG